MEKSESKGFFGFLPIIAGWRIQDIHTNLPGLDSQGNP
jgi:hypothetical protein